MEANTHLLMPIVESEANRKFETSSPTAEIYNEIYRILSSQCKDNILH